MGGLKRPGPPTSSGVGTSFGACVKPPQGQPSALPIWPLSNMAVKSATTRLYHRHLPKENLQRNIAIIQKSCPIFYATPLDFAWFIRSRMCQWRISSTYRQLAVTRPYRATPINHIQPNLYFIRRRIACTCTQPCHPQTQSPIRNSNCPAPASLAACGGRFIIQPKRALIPARPQQKDACIRKGSRL